MNYKKVFGGILCLFSVVQIYAVIFLDVGVTEWKLMLWVLLICMEFAASLVALELDPKCWKGENKVKTVIDVCCGSRMFLVR